MSRQDFVDQLTVLGFKPSEPGGNRVAFPYEVEVGKFSGRQIQLGFVVPDDFPQPAQRAAFFAPAPGTSSATRRSSSRRGCSPK